MLIAFKLFDRNGDNLISSEEFKHIETLFGDGDSTSFSEIDTNGDGNITYEEFKAMHGLKQHVGYA